MCLSLLDERMVSGLSTYPITVLKMFPFYLQLAGTIIDVWHILYCLNA